MTKNNPNSKNPKDTKNQLVSTKIRQSFSIIAKKSPNTINIARYESAVALLYQRENIHQIELKKSQEILSKSQEEITKIKYDLDKALKNAEEWKKEALYYRSIIKNIKKKYI